MKRLFSLTLLFLSTFSYSTAQIQKQVKKNTLRKTFTTQSPVPVPGTRIKIITDSGIIVIRLYDKTPKHRDNFLKLIKEHFYDSLLFHRVISTFMIQGGDPGSKYAQQGTFLGDGDVGYTIPAEFDTALFHKRGALAAARQSDEINPARESSGCQFYIVQGKKYTPEELSIMEQHLKRNFSAAAKEAYTTIGGTPFLDMNYTVFGEVEKGLEVIDKIAAAAKDPSDRPLKDIRMKISIIGKLQSPVLPKFSNLRPNHLKLK